MAASRMTGLTPEQRAAARDLGHRLATQTTDTTWTRVAAILRTNVPAAVTPRRAAGPERSPSPSSARPWVDRSSSRGGDRDTAGEVA